MLLCVCVFACLLVCSGVFDRLLVFGCLFVWNFVGLFGCLFVCVG